MKRALIAILVLFFVLEAWLTVRCMTVHRSFVEAIVVALSEPATQMMLVDFTFVTVIISVWLLLDAKKRGTSGWLWIALMPLAPTAALAGYLLARGSTKDA